MTAATYDPADIVRAVLVDLTRHSVPITFGPASLAKAAELAERMLRVFDVEGIADEEPVKS